MGGRIYIAQEDVEQDISGVGAMLNFFVYADGKGLGAKNVKSGGVSNGTGDSPTPKGSVVGGNKAAWAPKWKTSPVVGQESWKQTAGAGDRQKVGGGKLTGKVHEWKGTYGFIMPSAQVNHPDAAKHKGRIYFAQEDVEQEISGVGAIVSFFLYKDKSGLGASHVRPGKGGKAAAPQSGKQQLVKNTKLKAKKEAKESAPFDKTTRTAVSTTSLAGTVISSRRETIAWIRPDDPDSAIDHPKWAESERKNLFVHKDDVEGGDFPKVGATVTFSVYEDEKGLGAENLQVLEQGDGTLPEHLKEEVKEKTKTQNKPPSKVATKKTA